MFIILRCLLLFVIDPISLLTHPLIDLFAQSSDNTISLGNILSLLYASNMRKLRLNLLIDLPLIKE